MTAVTDQYERMQTIQSAAVLAGRRAWRKVDRTDLSRSWALAAEALAVLLGDYQEAAAMAGLAYVTDALAEQGEYVAPEAFVDPRGFAGQASDGRALASLLYSPVTAVKNHIRNGKSSAEALRMGGKVLDTMARTQVADAGRASAGVAIASRPAVGYVRYLNPPSCSRCAVLAGRFYRWNAGFQRHPGCDCIHHPAKNAEAARAEGLISDPYEYFNSLSESDQQKYFGKHEAQAIRDGGDLYQVVNSRRGMQPGGLTTKEGTSRRGAYGRAKRLTPEGIYKQNLSREKTLQLLESNGYILPGGQVPGGSILGDREGFGALGRGGSRVGVRNAVEEARRTGVRDPRLRATMTEVERRASDAQSRWDAVRDGRNPYSSKAPLSPKLAAAVEKDYLNAVVYGNAQWKLTARKSL